MAAAVAGAFSNIGHGLLVMHPAFKADLLL
jgi:hypothetical protein